ncbi:MAG: 50S ribosomal protein L10 [Balneolaceae bacterium]
MPTLTEKKAVVEEISQFLNESSAVYITNYKGMSVSEINELRSRFRESSVDFKVYKNTLVKRAMEKAGGFDDLYPYLDNQNGFAFVTENLGAPAKVIKTFSKDSGKPEFRAAVIEGDLFGENQLDSLASMKSKEEVIGDIVGLLLSPVSTIVRGLQAQGSNIAGAIKTIADKGENS